MTSEPIDRTGSAPAYRLYEPQAVPVPIVDGIWTVEGPVVQYPAGPFLIPCPTRMTVLALDDGGIALHSPTAFSESLLAQLNAIGPVRCLIAPNTFHHLNLLAWAEVCPQAQVFVPRRLPTGVMPSGRACRLSSEEPNGFEGILDCVEVDGGSWVETVFLHRPSRTAVFTDLVQNFEPSRVRGAVQRTLLRLAGAAGNPPRASMEMQLEAILRGKRRDVARSFETIRAWQAERILIAHGAQPTGEPDAMLEEAFRWAGSA